MAININDREKTLQRLRSRLLETKEWPITYMYKFIVPNNGDKVNKVIATLPPNGKTTFNPSKDLHYVAVTHVVKVASADAIIETTQNATNIEGVISL